MNYDLNKLTISLCLAFQESDGPFDILYMFDGGKEEVCLSKPEIAILSNQEFVVWIDITNRVASSERRWLRTSSRRS